jgi:hypothetical protein
MPDLTARLGLPILAPSQAQKHITHNEALRRLDGVVQTALASIGGNTPPLLPNDGEVHALGPTPTGEWSGQGGKIAQWQFDQWQFTAPQEGWQAWDLTDGMMRVYRGGSWVSLMQNLPGLGIDTSSDSQNKLAVASASSLFNHAGAGHQLKINKAATNDSATLLYQSNWSGHAEMGLAGDNNFHIKTSSNGGSWTDALVIDAASGIVSGAGVQSNSGDSTSGRLLSVGAFGLGNVSAAALSMSNLDATSSPEGTWRYEATTTGTYPAGLSGSSGLIEIKRYNANIVHQTIARNNADGGIWWRTYDGVSWQPWHRIFDNRNIIAGVSGTAGIPTGGLIEKGNNANGYYRRFACGLMQCWHTLSAVSNDSVRWTYPSVFFEPPVVTGSAIATVTSSFQLDGLAWVGSVAFSSRSKTDARRADTCYIFATGRWSNLV